MTSVFPYLAFNGTCEEAFDFYKSIFGGEFNDKNRFSEMPPDEKMPISEEDKSKIMHISLPIGETLLMGSDNPSSMGDAPSGGNFSVSVHVDSKDEADRIFTGLCAGGTVTMPLADMFWNAYFGMCKDKYGVNWMIHCDLSGK